MGVTVTVGKCYAHYLSGFQGSSGTAPTSTYLFRVGPDTLCYMTLFGGVENTVCYANLYSIGQMETDGAAYSAGATTKSAAIKTTPFKIILVSNALPSQIAGGTGPLDRFLMAAYDQDRFLVASANYIWVVNMATGAVTTNAITGSTHISSYDTVELGTARTSFTKQMAVSSSGYVGVPIVGYNAGVAVASWNAIINPLTGVVLAEGSTTAGTLSAIRAGLPASDAFFGVGSGYFYITVAAVATNISTGFGNAVAGSSDCGFFPVNPTSKLIVTHLGTNPEAFDYTNKIMSLTAASTWSQSATMATNSTNWAWLPGCGFLTASEYAMIQTSAFNTTGSGQNKILMCSTADGSILETINIVDQNGGQAHDTDIAAMTNTTTTIKSAAYEGDSASGTLFIADLFNYQPGNVGGAL